MEQFKKRWEIQHNWQLIFPLLGILANFYLAYRLVASVFLKGANIYVILMVSTALYFVFLKFFLWWFKKVEHKWVVKYRWEMIRIFLVFALTGTTSAFISKPIMAFLHITKENLNAFLYWVLYIIIGLIFYQVLLVTIGWLFGQFRFFWEFEKKILRRFGFKRFFD